MNRVLSELQANGMQVTEIDGDEYVLFDELNHQTTSPFTTNEYDFDEGFYNGTFTYRSPITGQLHEGTPEAYGRERIAAYIVDKVVVTDRTVSILDLGSGTADLSRTIPASVRPGIELVNSDISGPWSPLGTQSLLLKGAKKLRAQSAEPYAGVLNVQFDFNTTDWPYPPDSFDCIATNMALHHVAPERKHLVAQRIFDSLKAGGSLILNDVFTYNRDRTTFTTAGEKGPSECKGSVEALGNIIMRLGEVGFSLPALASQIAEDENSYTSTDLARALVNVDEPFPVSRAVWVVTAKKS